MKTPAQMISYPFPKGTNPYIELLRGWADRCIISRYKKLPDGPREMARKTNYGDVTAYYYPTATLEKAIPICRWMIYVGCYDDSFGTYGPEVLRPVNQRVDEVYRGGSIGPADTGLGREFLLQVEKLMGEFSMFATPEWAERFASSNKLFLDALVTDKEYSFKKQVHYPSLEEYLAIRQNIVAVYPCVNIAEIVADFILPTELEMHPVIRRLHELTTLLMAICNDFFSVEKERRDHEAMNLILVMENERGCSTEQAYEAAAEIHKGFVDEFAKLRSSLPDTRERNGALDAYVSTLERMIHGNLLWHLTTTRHQV